MENELAQWTVGCLPLIASCSVHFASAGHFYTESVTMHLHQCRMCVS
uniref:Uncharacterized protein n=1 Tax=Arundo donax TaxID=35708 RepID=A0A0A9ADA0_ARUDO